MCEDDPQEGVQMQDEPEKEKENWQGLAEKAGAKKNHDSEQEEPSRGEVEKTEIEELADDPGAPPQEGNNIQDEPENKIGPG